MILATFSPWLNAVPFFKLVFKIIVELFHTTYTFDPIVVVFKSDTFVALDNNTGGEKLAPLSMLDRNNMPVFADFQTTNTLLLLAAVISGS
jgi:hypothetical protein